MSKSKKKKLASKQGDKSNIKQIVCVDCPRDISLIVKQDDCKICEYHSQGYCKYVLPAQFIAVVSSGTPLKFNRTLFQSMSTDLANTTRNYYLLTDIMQPVRNIKEYPNYSRIKSRFLSGEFKTKQEMAMTGRMVSSVSHPVLSLVESDNTQDPAILLGGKQYVISENGSTGTGEGDWEIIYYLYDTYSLDGFADIKLKDRWYKVRMSPIESSKENYVVAKRGKHLVVGTI